MKHCKSVLSVIVVIALIVSTIMIGNTGPFAEGGDQGYPVPELFPEVNRFMDEDEKKTIVSRIDGYGDALNGNRRLVIADPHYNAVASGSSQTYAMLDIPFSSYYYTYKHSSAVIRNELW